MNLSLKVKKMLESCSRGNAKEEKEEKSKKAKKQKKQPKILAIVH